MKKTTRIAAVSAVALLCGGWWVRSSAEPPRHPAPKSANGNLVVELCDGETAAEVSGVKEGETLSRSQAQAVSDRLMAEWRRKNPSARWDDAVRVAAAGQGGEGGSAAPAAQKPAGATAEPATQEGHVYGSFTERDEKIWAAATQQFIDEGHAIFHDAKRLGGTIGVSCDMCHPNAANTHPETYPKFQVQFGRVALLRDMINWCIQNPVRGKPLPDDDPRLKALEAYILAQRKGVALEYGKH
jgi:thiosulfate dehydrogenase